MRRTGEPEEIGVCGPLLGVIADREYDDRECLLVVGDLVAFWTDGVTERRHAGGMFGEQRLHSLLARAADRPAADVAREIDQAVLDFAPGLPHDDVAVLIARVTAVAGRSDDARPSAVEPVRASASPSRRDRDTGRPEDSAGPTGVARVMTRPAEAQDVRELRLVVTAPDYDEALHFYRDVLGLRERAAFTSPGGRVAILEAGNATLEITDPAHAAFIDEVEVGQRVAGHIRVAFEVERFPRHGEQARDRGGHGDRRADGHAVELAERTPRGAGGPAAHALHRARRARLIRAHSGSGTHGARLTPECANRD